MKCAASGTLPQDWKDFPELEQWQDWKNYPDLVQLDSLSDGPGLELLAWLVDTFGDIVTHCKLKERVKDYDPGDLLSNMSLDDFVFTFVQVQHNINKWTLVYRAWKEQYIAAWKEKDCVEACDTDKKSLGEESVDFKRVKKINQIGYEYPTGSGVAGKDGKRRYNSVTKFLYKALYVQDNPLVDENRNALRQALVQLAEHRASQWSDIDEAPAKAKKSRSDDITKDPELDEIHGLAWDLPRPTSNNMCAI